ncbi:hypothetical protein L3Q82_009703 [Scortum barcoo]|uniref:Uncharacterized protein n=1 Tax=Scortum barcoo TaxID=214431 RepID=A0ACB8WGU8_9TELE|nr:hypothetical protein L3Q82_009703 [Scortum barcoo]
MTPDYANSEVTRINVESVCKFAKTMSDSVVFSGPLPNLTSDDMYSRRNVVIPPVVNEVVSGKRLHVTAGAPVLFVLSSLAGSSLILVVVHLSEVHPGLVVGT